MKKHFPTKIECNYKTCVMESIYYLYKAVNFYLKSNILFFKLIYIIISGKVKELQLSKCIQ